MRLRPLQILPRTFTRLVSHDVNYAYRKDIVAANPPAYYPLLGSVRSSTPVWRLPDFVEKFRTADFSLLEHRRHPDLVHLEGRVRSVRKAGKALYFIDMVQDGTKVQLYASNKLLGLSKEEFASVHNFIRKGDHVVAEGYAYRTDVGELSLMTAKPITVASPCLNSVSLPDKVSNRNLINSNRVMNYLVDGTLQQKIMVKSIITQAIRDFFLADNFLEVLTPILSGGGTGANAEPFTTSLKALSGDSLHLRVAPELWLKRLVISGFDKVFEIGTNFRNEGVDATHNPEFTTCEFYRSFTTLPELMAITEDLFRVIYTRLESKTDQIAVLREQLPQLRVLGEGNFNKVEFIPTLEQKTGVPLPRVLDSESLLQYFDAISLKPPAQKQPAALLDHLCGVFLESISTENPNCPVFIYNQPAAMSPLAKSRDIEYDGRTYEISLRFELFINGKEYVNSYEEENSPYAQREKFLLQSKAKADYNDDEALIPDWQYVELMEYGLPPTGGWGCGIDRLSMLFSGSLRIEDVLTFGTVRDVVRQ